MLRKMSLSVESYPPKLTDTEVSNLVRAAKDWSAANGLCVRPAPSFVPSQTDPSGVLAVNAPVTLFPSPFPQHCFEQGKSIQKAYNTLYARVAQDQDFLWQIVNAYDPRPP